MVYRPVKSPLSRGRSHRRRGVAAAVTLALVAAAPDVEASAPATADDPTRGGSAIVVGAGQPAVFDPSLQRVSYAFVEAGIMGAIFGHLAFANAETGEVELYFLESLEPNADASVWTMTLHPGITFSDGTPLDADAIKFNIERSADPATGSRFQQAAEGLALEVIDEQTLQVTLPEADPLWDADLVANFAGIGSPTAIQQAIDEGVEVGTRPVGAGPFMVTDWDPGQTIVLERNPYFEDFMPGRPYLDEITFENVSDFGQQATAIETGAAQIALTNGGGPTDQLLEDANAVVTYAGGGSSIFLNTTIPPFDDVRARRALALAVDRDILSDAFNPGTAPSTTLFAETSPFHNPEYSWPEQDVEEAQRLFDELAAEGKPVSFSYTTYSTPQQTNVIDGLIAQLAEFDNVTFEADVRTFPEYTDAGVTAEYQSLAWGTFFTNPIPLLVEYYYPGSTLATHGWDNADVKAAMDRLATASTVEEQKEIWDVVQREMVEEMPAVWLGTSVLTVGYADGLIVPRSINLGTYPLWSEVGYE